MSRWFRHYAGMMRDEKLVGVALRAKQPVERTLWLWGAILESAAELNDGGRYVLDTAEAAYFLRADEADICAVLDALTAAGRLAEGRVVNWGARQFHSDRSAPRQAAYRERKRSHRSDADDRQEDGDGEVTTVSRHGDAPETELETKKKERAPSLRSGGARKGTRLPDDFSLSEAEIEFAAKHHFAGDSLQAVFSDFCDYWHARAGPLGVKLDWPATWRRWIREEAKKQAKRGTNGNHRQNGSSSRDEFREALRELRDGSTDGCEAPSRPPLRLLSGG